MKADDLMSYDRKARQQRQREETLSRINDVIGLLDDITVPVVLFQGHYAEMRAEIDVLLDEVDIDDLELFANDIAPARFDEVRAAKRARMERVAFRDSLIRTMRSPTFKKLMPHAKVEQAALYHVELHREAYETDARERLGLRHRRGALSR